MRGAIVPRHLEGNRQEHRGVLAQRMSQCCVARRACRLQQQHIECRAARSARMQCIQHPRIAFARPGPGAHLCQRAIIDGDDQQARV